MNFILLRIKFITFLYIYNVTAFSKQTVNTKTVYFKIKQAEQ